MRDIFADTIKMWGEEAQIDMAIEEMAELILALQHRRRGRVGNEEVASEVADVGIMLEQVARIIGTDLVASARRHKMDRLHDRVYNGAMAYMGQHILEDQVID